MNLNDHQLNLRYKLLRPSTSQIIMFFHFCHYLGLRKNNNLLFCTLSSWSLSFNMGAFLETEPRYFHSETKVLARRFEDELKRPALSGELVSEKKQANGSHEISMASVVLLCETHGTLLGLRSPDDSSHWVTLWDHRLEIVERKRQFFFWEYEITEAFGVFLPVGV